MNPGGNDVCSCSAFLEHVPGAAIMTLTFERWALISGTHSCLGLELKTGELRGNRMSETFLLCGACSFQYRTAATQRRLTLLTLVSHRVSAARPNHKVSMCLSLWAGANSLNSSKPLLTAMEESANAPQCLMVGCEAVLQQNRPPETCFKRTQRPRFMGLLFGSLSPTVLFPPPCQNPPGGLGTSSVFRNVSAATVMKCEGRQKCSLHLRISAALQLAGLCETHHGVFER